MVDSSSHHTRPAPPLVYIVDDDPSIRQALSDLCTSVGYEVRAFANPLEFSPRAPMDRPACLLLDVRLQGANGLDFQESLLREGCGVPVILMSGHADVPMSVRAMRAGAIDFIQKPFREQDLLDAISAAMAEWRRRVPVLKRQRDWLQRYASLTPREREIIRQVLAGKLSKQVADNLCISLITVKIHRASAMKKLGARSLVELTRIGDALGIGEGCEDMQLGVNTPFSSHASGTRAHREPAGARGHRLRQVF